MCSFGICNMSPICNHKLRTRSTNPEFCFKRVCFLSASSRAVLWLCVSTLSAWHHTLTTSVYKTCNCTLQSCHTCPHGFCIVFSQCLWASVMVKTAARGHGQMVHMHSSHSCMRFCSCFHHHTCPQALTEYNAATAHTPCGSMQSC